MSRAQLHTLTDQFSSKIQRKHSPNRDCDLQILYRSINVNGSHEASWFQSVLGKIPYDWFLKHRIHRNYISRMNN